MKVLCPLIPEQEQIANYIDQKQLNFENLIKETQSAINLLQERRTALISAAVTGKIDVRGFADSLPNSSPA